LTTDAEFVYNILAYSLRINGTKKQVLDM